MLEAFGASGNVPQLLDGGQGRTWRAGDLVLKPVGREDEHHWVSEVLRSWPIDSGVRVPQPVPGAGGAWTSDGWGAHRWLPGDTATAKKDPDVFHEVSRDFHRVVADMQRPHFLDERDDPWSFGDRVAWEGQEPQGHPPTLALLRSALAALEPMDLPSQVVHGDLAGNVLTHAGLPPAVIDWPPYFRPEGWALAVIAMDAVCWEGAPISLLDEWAAQPGWDQLLLRAVIYRVGTRGRNEALGLSPVGSDGYVARRGTSVDLVLDRIGRRT